MEFIDKVMQWPAIIQGILGSAFFAAIYWVMRFLFSRLRLIISNGSRKRRIDYLNTECLRYKAALSDDNGQSTILIVILIFDALGSASRAALSLVIGLVAGEFWPILKVVGFCFALYFLFGSMSSLRDIHSDDASELKRRLDELTAELTKLEADD